MHALPDRNSPGTWRRWRGSRADPASTPYRRDRVGITRAGAYFSVDTGKYSIAPWLASEVANLLV